jgi:hypothetical protein
MMEGPSEWQYMDRDDTTTSNMYNSLFLGHFWTNTQHSRQAERKEGEKREGGVGDGGKEGKAVLSLFPSSRVALFNLRKGGEGNSTNKFSSICLLLAMRQGLLFWCPDVTLLPNYHIYTLHLVPYAHTPSLVYISAALF